MQITALLNSVPGILVYVILLGWVGALSGCDSTEPGADPGVDLDALFLPPDASEIQMIRDDWATRDLSPADVQVLAIDTSLVFGSSRVTRIVSHTVAGVSHTGAIVSPVSDGSGTFPVMVYNHFGDEGVDLDGTIALISIGLGGIDSDFVLVVPSFRAETITSNGIEYQSEGPPSPWDFDVDDAIALLNVALEMVPEADETRIGALGVSRGGGVSLIMAARDPRIDVVIDYFGPTNFMLDSARDETRSALEGNARDLPGFIYLNDTVLTPWQEGALTVDEVRLEYIRRSPVFFVDSLPRIQVHHGELDDIVSVEHARSMEQFLVDSGRASSEFEVFIYPAAGHDVIEMPESFARAATFFNENVTLASLK